MVFRPSLYADWQKIKLLVHFALLLHPLVCYCLSCYSWKPRASFSGCVSRHTKTYCHSSLRSAIWYNGHGCVYCTHYHLTSSRLMGETYLMKLKADRLLQNWVTVILLLLLLISKCVFFFVFFLNSHPFNADMRSMSVVLGVPVCRLDVPWWLSLSVHVVHCGPLPGWGLWNPTVPRQGWFGFLLYISKKCKQNK